MEKKYFFFDIDGTLSPSGSMQLSPSTEDTLRRLRANGHFTAIATGRLQSNAAAFGEAHGFDAVVSDGGYSATMGGRLLFMEGLDKGAVKTVCARLDEIGVPWAVCPENRIVRLSRDGRFERAAGENYFRTDVDPALDLDRYPFIYKLFIACSPAREAEFDLCGLPSVRFSEQMLFIEPTSKAEGIRRVMALLGADCRDVVVFGDGTNDLQMFDPEWTSIAMGNADEALKAAADYVTTTVDEDGVTHACRHFGWI